MIANNIIDNSHIYDGKKSYLIDTNILLSLYGHPYFCNCDQSNRKLSLAQKQFNKALDSNSRIYVPAIVISEFLNRCLKASFFDFKQKYKHLNKKLDYKLDYRTSNEYRDDLNHYLEVLKNVVFSKLTYINDSFNTADLNSLFTFNNDDFNDKILIHIANTNNLYIISADMDIKKIVYS